VHTLLFFVNKDSLCFTCSKKICSKEKSLYYFHKKLKIKKTKKTFLGFFRWVFWVGFLLATLREGDLPEVLRPAPSQGDQLPQEGVRTHLQPPSQEEAEVNCTQPTRLCCFVGGCDDDVVSV
jgi:hypothetical protein